MSPCATKMHKHGNHAGFKSVRRRLPGQRSAYESTWDKLTSDCKGYPNSAVFVKALWPRRFSFLLCEKDPSTFQDLEQWASEVSDLPNCTGIELHLGDWRDRFLRGLSFSGDLIFFSFDPYMFNQRFQVKRPRPGNMYPEDLELMRSITSTMRQKIVIQLSTYDTNDGNSPEKVIEAVHKEFRASDVEVSEPVKVKRKMMSIVLTKNIQSSRWLRNLPKSFESWMERARKLAP